MKKTLIALAALAATSAAFAQVTLTGEVRAGFQRSNATGNPSGLTVSDATFKLDVVEDIEGGLKAAAGMQFDQAGNTFGGAQNRRNTYLSLTGGFGQLRVDQTRSSDLLVRALVAPSNLDQGIYDTSNVLSRGEIDGISYSAKLSDFTLTAAYLEGVTDGKASAGSTAFVLSGGYKAGALEAGLAYKSYSFNSVYATALSIPLAEIQRSTNLEAFATYDFGVAKVGLGWDGANPGQKKSDLHDASAYGIGVAVPVGKAITLGANYAKRDVAEVRELAAQYVFSKRTSANLSYGYQQNKVTAANDGYQYRLSLSHKF